MGQSRWTNCLGEGHSGKSENWFLDNLIPRDYSDSEIPNGYRPLKDGESIRKDDLVDYQGEHEVCWKKVIDWDPRCFNEPYTKKDYCLIIRKKETQK